MKRKVVALLTAIMVMAMGTMTVSAANVPSNGNNGTNQEQPTPPGDDNQIPGDDNQTPTESKEPTVAEINAAFSATVSATPVNVASAIKGTGVTVSAATADDAAMFANTLNSELKNPVEYLAKLADYGVRISDSMKAAIKEGKKVKTEMLAVVDLKPTADANGTYTLTVPGLRAGAVVYLLHDTDSDYVQIIPAYVSGKNTIVFHWNGDFSPFAIVQMSVEGENGTLTAPVTGDTFPATAAAMAIICLAGVVVCGKKVKFN